MTEVKDTGDLGRKGASMGSQLWRKADSSLNFVPIPVMAGRQMVALYLPSEKRPVFRDLCDKPSSQPRLAQELLAQSKKLHVAVTYEN